MASEKISQLASGNPAQSGDLIPIARSGSNFSLTAQSIAGTPHTVTRNAQTGTTYAIQDSDLGKLVTFSNTSDIAVSIAQAGTAGAFADGWFCYLKNISTGTVIFTPTVSTIETAVQMIIPPGGGCLVYSDASNYRILDAIDAPSAFLGPGCPITTNIVNTGTSALVGSANAVRAWQFSLQAHTLITKGTCAAGATVAASTFAVGFYTANGGTLITQAKFDGSSSTQQVITLSKSTLLLKGTYFMGWTATDSATLTVLASVNTTTGPMFGAGGQAFYNANRTRMATASTTASSGNLPSSLGTLSALTNVFFPVPVFES